MIRRLIKRLLARTGYRIAPLWEPTPRTLYASLRRLAEAGIQPRTILDVGVHRDGTPSLMAAYPEAKHLLFEPVAEFAEDIHRVYAGLDHELVAAAVAARSGSVRLHVTQGLTHSSIRPPDADDDASWNETATRTVPSVTLDEVSAGRTLVAPYLIKIDIDSYEKDLEVLDGATDVLGSTNCVVLESLLGQFEDRPLTSLRSRLERMESLGFFPWDLVEPSSKKGIFFQCDVVFLAERLRSDPKLVPWLDTEVLRNPLG